MTEVKYHWQLTIDSRPRESCYSSPVEQETAHSNRRSVQPASSAASSGHGGGQEGDREESEGDRETGWGLHDWWADWYWAVSSQEYLTLYSQSVRASDKVTSLCNPGRVVRSLWSAACRLLYHEYTVKVKKYSVGCFMAEESWCKQTFDLWPRLEQSES